MHRHPVRVYYEDTDAGGIVYHANYLKFVERARSEWVRALGLDQKRLREERGLIIVVRRMEVDFLRPALYDDLLRLARGRHAPVAAGVFGADMQVHLVNDGPVTIPVTVR